MAKVHRVYNALRTGIEERGGSVVFERHGYRYGAWLVELDGKRGEFVSNGNGFEDLDTLYIPKPGMTHPNHWSHYSFALVDGAIERLVGKLE